MLIGFGAIAVLFWVIPWFAAWRSGEAGLGDVVRWHGGWRQWLSMGFVLLGAALWLISLLSQRLTRIIYVGWMSAAVPVGIVMSTVMLSLVFFVVLPVFSLIVRRSDPMRRAFRAEGSYWEPHKQVEPSLERLKRLF